MIADIELILCAKLCSNTLQLYTQYLCTSLRGWFKYFPFEDKQGGTELYWFIDEVTLILYIIKSPRQICMIFKT